MPREDIKMKHWDYQYPRQNKLNLNKFNPSDDKRYS